VTDHDKPIYTHDLKTIHQEHKISYDDLVKLNHNLQLENQQLRELLAQYGQRIQRFQRIAKGFQDEPPIPGVG